VESGHCGSKKSLVPTIHNKIAYGKFIRMSPDYDDSDEESEEESDEDSDDSSSESEDDPLF
jgi:hypothetical protein